MIPQQLIASRKNRTRPWREWNTLKRLWASLYLIWALDALLLLVTIIGAQVHRDAMQVVGKHTALSIIHAQGIKTSLADMDADVANELLGPPGQMKKDVLEYEEKRKDASSDLIEAAKNISFEGEQEPIERIQLFLGTFEALVQRARDLHNEGDATYVDAYREAAEVMDKKLLPETDRLDKVNRKELDKAYDSASNWSAGSALMVLAAGSALLAALFIVQKFLTERMRRVLNAMLLAATLITLGFIFYTFQTLAAERHHLKVATEDAFNSIHALLQAKAAAYAANADESRYVLDPKHQAEHQQQFNVRAAALASLPKGSTWAQVLQAASQNRSLDGFSGYLADELNNITFEGERTAAVSALEHFIAYLSIDDQLRDLVEHGKRAEAVELCIGTKATESNTVFNNFDDAIDKTLEINQKHFDQAVEHGLAALSYYELKATIIALGIALLTFFGLLKRIQEYR